MISKGHIAEWRSTTPWANDWQVEQDLVISRALVEIFSDDHLRSALAFRGGTALHKLYFDPAERYSEDIDLVRADNGPVGPILDRLRSTLEPWLGPAKYKGKDRSSTLVFSFESEGTPMVRLRLKVEINVRETFNLDGLRLVPFGLSSRYFTGSADITTFSLEELLATKLRALLQRSKGRDVFDLDRALALPSPPDVDRIIVIFLGYIQRQGVTVSRSKFEESLAGKAEDSDFLNDIHALLATSAPRYRSLDGLQRVQAEVISRLPGKPWTGRSQ